MTAIAHDWRVLYFFSKRGGIWFLWGFFLPLPFASYFGISPPWRFGKRLYDTGMTFLNSGVGDGFVLHRRRPGGLGIFAMKTKKDERGNHVVLLFEGLGAIVHGSIII